MNEYQYNKKFQRLVSLHEELPYVKKCRRQLEICEGIEGVVSIILLIVIIVMSN